MTAVMVGPFWTVHQLPVQMISEATRRCSTWQWIEPYSARADAWWVHLCWLPIDANNVVNLNSSIDIGPFLTGQGLPSRRSQGSSSTGWMDVGVSTLKLPRTNSPRQLLAERSLVAAPIRSRKSFPGIACVGWYFWRVLVTDIVIYPSSRIRYTRTCWQCSPVRCDL